MKKIHLSIALALFAGTIALCPAIAIAQNPQEDKAAQDKAAQEAEFMSNWHKTCYTKKPIDADKCYQLSKELIEKYPASNYKDNAIKNIKSYEQNKAFEKIKAALDAYYTNPPDAAKLEQLFTAGEEFYKYVPDDPYFVAQLALAGTNAVFGPIEYKNLGKVKPYVEKGMKVFESATPAKDFKPDQWNLFHELIRAQGNQFLGHFLIETKGNQDDALAYLTKATEMKSKDGGGWKDPNNYLLRSSIYNKKYNDLRKQYDQLPEDQKKSDAGKALIIQVNQLLDTKLIPEYARILATTAKAEYKSVYDQTKRVFDSYWIFRTDAPEKAAAYLKAFEADPTVVGPEVPAKAEDTAMNAPDAPNTNSPVKTVTHTSPSAHRARGTTTSDNSGKKGTPAKKTQKSGKRGK